MKKLPDTFRNYANEPEIVYQSVNITGLLINYHTSYEMRISHICAIEVSNLTK